MFANNGLPVPDYIGGALYGAIGVTYRNGNKNLRGLQQAFEIFKKFKQIVPFNILKNSCTMLHPERLLPEKEKSKGYKIDSMHSGDYAAMLCVSHIHQSHTRASFDFFASVDSVAFKVSIDFGTAYIGMCPQLAPVTKEDRVLNKLVARHFAQNAILRAHSSHYLSYASGDTGPVKTSSDHRYLFLSDYSDSIVTPDDCVTLNDAIGGIVEEGGV